MTAATDLLARCRAAGVALAAGEGNALRWEADADPPADLLADLADNKAAVLDLLARPRGDAAAADALLVELRAEVARVALAFGGRPPAALAVLLADALALGERFAREHDAEAARGWDALQLLADLVPHVQSIAGNFAK